SGGSGERIGPGVPPHPGPYPGVRHERSRSRKGVLPPSGVRRGIESADGGSRRDQVREATTEGGSRTAVVERPAILLYTRLRRTPYFHSSRRHGVQIYSVYNHFYHPRHYGDPVGEYWH